MINSGLGSILERRSEGDLPDKITHKYTLYSVAPNDVIQAEKLMDYGYEFHDRVLLFEIDLISTKELRLSQMPGYQMVDLDHKDDITTEMISIAFEGFSDDRRFNLSKHEDKQERIELIRAYINEGMKKENMISVALYKEDIIGFTIITKDGSFGENIMGVTKQSIAGKACAFPLYNYMLDSMISLGCKKYCGNVSSKNINSINLHFQLGGRVTGVRDEYIFRN